MSTARLPSLHVSGALTCGQFTSPPGAIDNQAIAPGGPGNYLAGDKIQHGVRATHAQDSDATAAAQTRGIHVAEGAGVIMEFQAGLVAPCTGDATVTVDLLVNGSSVLNAAISLTSSHTARQVVAAAINTADYSADDVFEVEITVDAGTGALGTGVFVNLVAREDPQ